MSTNTSRTDMRIAETEGSQAVPEVEIRRVVARIAARAGALVLAGLGLGAGGHALLEAPPPPSPPGTSEPAVCQCQCSPTAPIADCRVAADWFRAEAEACGVSSEALDRIARELLGPPPDQLSSE